MDDRIKDVEKQIADLKSRWPAHSVPPAMIQQLDELEEELEQLRSEDKHTEESDAERAE
jgi:hypothetical protein